MFVTKVLQLRLHLFPWTAIIFLKNIIIAVPYSTPSPTRSGVAFTYKGAADFSPYTFPCAARGRRNHQGSGRHQPHPIQPHTLSPAQPGAAFTFKGAANSSRAWFGLLPFPCVARGRPHLQESHELHPRLVRGSPSQAYSRQIRAPSPSPAQPGVVFTFKGAADFNST